MDGFKPLGFLFNQGDFFLLFIPGVLVATVLLATVLISLLFSVLLGTVDVLAAILVFL